MAVYIDLNGFSEFDDTKANVPMVEYIDLYVFPDFGDIKANVSIVVYIDLYDFPDFDNIKANVGIAFNKYVNVSVVRFNLKRCITAFKHNYYILDSVDCVSSYTR